MAVMVGLWVAVGVLLIGWAVLWWRCDRAGDKFAWLERWTQVVQTRLNVLEQGLSAVEVLEESDRMKGFDIKRLETDRESFAVDLASLRSLCESLCGELGHQWKELERGEGGWEGDLYERPWYALKCTRCGAEVRRVDEAKEQS
ncbi:MAG: hypothetical protein GX601_09135 [Anaerolineales bacterium]|nr:hypothetical protein [Anaerolineales bacterium]